MQNHNLSRPADSNEPLRKALFPRIVTTIVVIAVFTVVWFGIAGRVTWWQGWAFLLTFIVYSTTLVWRLSKLDPELVRERNRPADAVEHWDRVVMGSYSAILVVLLTLCALDGGRLGWSSVRSGVQIIGWILLIVSGVIVWRAMMTNAYLSSWARTQNDRGQVVVQEGMYRHIRHPMYLGIIAGFLGLPLALASWWGMIPSVVIVGLFVYRTHREDQMLIDGLAGYAEYIEQVRYKLLPGIW